jgi:hypothetical protein
MDCKILKNHILYIHCKATYVLYESGLGRYPNTPERNQHALKPYGRKKC